MTKGAHLGACVTGVADSIATNCDVGAVRVFFLWSDFADDPCVRDVGTPVTGDVVVVNGAEGVGPINPLLVW